MRWSRVFWSHHIHIVFEMVYDALQVNRFESAQCRHTHTNTWEESTIRKTFPHLGSAGANPIKADRTLYIGYSRCLCLDRVISIELVVNSSKRSTSLADSLDARLCSGICELFLSTRDLLQISRYFFRKIVGEGKSSRNIFGGTSFSNFCSFFCSFFSNLFFVIIRRTWAAAFGRKKNHEIIALIISRIPRIIAKKLLKIVIKWTNFWTKDNRTLALFANYPVTRKRPFAIKQRGNKVPKKSKKYTIQMMHNWYWKKEQKKMAQNMRKSFKCSGISTGVFATIKRNFEHFTMSGSGKGLLGLWLYRSGESEWAVKEGSPLHNEEDLVVRFQWTFRTATSASILIDSSHLSYTNAKASSTTASATSSSSSSDRAKRSDKRSDDKIVDKTSIIFTLNNQVGGLARALQVFQELGINVLHLELQNTRSDVDQVHICERCTANAHALGWLWSA